LQEVVRHQSSDLVPSQNLEVALVSSYAGSHPVSVRVGSHDHVSADFVGQFHAWVEDVTEFRVRLLASREFWVHNRLAWHWNNVAEAAPSEGAVVKHLTRPVQRSVNNLQLVGVFLDHVLVDVDRFQLGQVGFVDIFADQLQSAFSAQLLDWSCLNAEDIFNLLRVNKEAVSVFRPHLGTVFAVSLVAVVLLGVVGSSDVDPGKGVQVADSEGQFRRWT